MTRIVRLGSIDGATRGNYFSGSLLDGTKALDPASGEWLYLKDRPTPQPPPEEHDFWLREGIV